MSDITVNPYPRDGKPHHIYANASDRSRLGEMKLGTAEVRIDVPERASEVATALAQWCQRNPHLVAAARQSWRKSHDQAQAIPDDLARNVPGASLRRIAQEKREADRRRSRWWAFVARAVRADAGQPWISGAKGEERIARVLARVARRGDWRVLHSIPLPKGGDIDHLIVGHDGVVVISIKRHPRAKVSVGAYDVYVNSAKTNHVGQARNQAGEASRVLSAACGFDVKVIPCIAIVQTNPWGPVIKFSGDPEGVLIATNWNLPRVLWDAEQGLSDEQIEAIYEAARRPATWKK